MQPGTERCLLNMQNFLKRFSVVSGFAVLIVLLIAGTAVTRHRLAIQIANQQRVVDARELSLALERTESLLKDAETGQRGFLYTGDKKYLAPYNLATSQLAVHIDRLSQLTAQNPQESQSVAEIRTLAHQKLDELATTISLFQAGKPDQARVIVLSDTGLAIMDQFRDVVSSLQQQENSLVAERVVEYRDSINATITSIYLAGVLGIAGLIFLAVAILREMRLRETHAQEIRTREEWFRITLTSIGDAVIATDQHGKVTFMNPVAETLTGSTARENSGLDIRTVFPIFNEFTGEITANPVQKVMEKGIVVGLANHTVLKHADGHLIPIEDSAAPIRDDKNRLIGVVLVFRDVTNERNAQDLMRKTEKLAAAARLSATVAHEINNPLEAVGNLIFIAKTAEAVPADVVQQLTLAEQELERVAHITRQTLGFYRESNEAALIRVDGLVEAVLKLYSNKLKTKNIQVDLKFGECPPILCVQGELKQVISNLVSNAIDAVPTDGRIVIRLNGIADVSGKGVQLCIDDDGPGIPAEIVSRIFEPFFTTKKDIGTGLGLWVTREIVERHGGSITVRPTGNDGTRGASFSICLPCDPNRQPTAPTLTH